MIFTYEDGLSRYGNKYNLKKAVEKEELYKIEKGYYSDQKYVPEVNIISMKYPKAIFTLNSAFYYYNLTDVIPDQYYLATDRDASKIPDKRVIQVYEKKELLEMGMTSLDYQGYNIRIYSKERLLVELIRHRSKFSFDYYKEVLLNFRESIYDMDIPAVQDYAYEIPKSKMVLETIRREVL